jgi:hypothetical protein
MFSKIALLLLASTCPAQRPHKLLPTAHLAHDISGLPNAVLALPDPADKAAVKALLANIHHEISNFILRQIEASPSISECELQKQLDDAFSVDKNICGNPQSDASPRVFTDDWGRATRRRVFVVTYYVWFGLYGEGETVLQSYIWEQGRGVRLGVSTTPDIFSGIVTRAQKVCRFPNPDRYWILVSGTVSGASGRVLSGVAAVFEVGPEKVTQIWSAPDAGNVTAYVSPFGERWEIQHANTEPSDDSHPHENLLDIYQVDYEAQSYHRVAHLPID